MLKKEMVEEELARRTYFVKRLVAAGWDTRGWERLFNSGFSLTPEAQAEYRNAELALRLSYYIKDNYILLEFRENELVQQSARQAGTLSSDVNLLPSLRFYPDGNLGLVLDELITELKRPSEDTYPDLIKKMIPLCQLILLEIEEGLVKLSSLGQ